MFGANGVDVAFRDGVEEDVSGLRIVIPGKMPAPAPAVSVVIPLPVGVVGVDVVLFGVVEAVAPLPAVAFDGLGFPPGSVPGNVRFGCGEMANSPRASPAGMATGLSMRPGIGLKATSG